MVEQWSSKPPVWVRFLLSLSLFINKLKLPISFRKNKHLKFSVLTEGSLNTTSFVCRSFLPLKTLPNPTFSNNYLMILFFMYIKGWKNTHITLNRFFKLNSLINDYVPINLTQPYIKSDLSRYNYFTNNNNTSLIIRPLLQNKNSVNISSLNRVEISKNTHFIANKILSYVLNKSTIKFRNKTKVSLTKIDYKSLILNDSFFSDMNSGLFQNLLNVYNNQKVFYKKSYNTLSEISLSSKLPKKSFKDLYLRLPSSISFKKQKFHQPAYLLYIQKFNTYYFNKSLIRLKFMKESIGRIDSNLPINDEVGLNFLRRKFRDYSFRVKQKIKKVTIIHAKTNNSLSQNQKTDYTKSNQSFLIKKPSNQLLKSNNPVYSIYHYMDFIANPFFIKSRLLEVEDISLKIFNNFFLKNNPIAVKSISNFNHSLLTTNINPSHVFNKVINKKAFDFFSSYKFYQNIIPWYHTTLVRFFEHISGLKVMLQLYPFINQQINYDWLIRYRSWLPRMSFYERMLGHKFFLEEAIHIIHLSFYYKDSKLFSSWLKAIILRISFWKTRSIFRFLKYLMISHFHIVFKDLGIKGLKIRLKGKISVAGNSRKRSILYRIGKTSYSQTNLRVSHHKSIINTFTGVMGFQVWIFY